MTFTSHVPSSPKPLPIQNIDILAPYWFDSALVTCNETFSLNTISFINRTFFPNGTLFFNETNTTFSDNKTTCQYTSTVYYGNRYSSSLEERATKEIRAAFFDTGRFFRIFNLFVVTWVITDTESESKVMVNIIVWFLNKYFLLSLLGKCLSVHLCQRWRKHICDI